MVCDGRKHRLPTLRLIVERVWSNSARPRTDSHQPSPSRVPAFSKWVEGCQHPNALPAIRALVPTEQPAAFTSRRRRGRVPASPARVAEVVLS